jgi:hypothetical protein
MEGEGEGGWIWQEVWEEATATRKGISKPIYSKNITGKTLGATWTSEDMLNLKKYDWRTKLNVNSVNNLIWLTPQFYSPDAESCG